MRDRLRIAQAKLERVGDDALAQIEKLGAAADLENLTDGELAILLTRIIAEGERRKNSKS